MPMKLDQYLTDLIQSEPWLLLCILVLQCHFITVKSTISIVGSLLSTWEALPISATAICLFRWAARRSSFRCADG